MTEESDDPESGSILVHFLTWRSNGSCMALHIIMHFLHFFDFTELNTLVKTLDSRYDNKMCKEGGIFIKKNRAVGNPFTSLAPVNSPNWAVHNR